VNERNLRSRRFEGFAACSNVREGLATERSPKVAEEDQQDAGAARQLQQAVAVLRLRLAQGLGQSVVIRHGDSFRPAGVGAPD